MQMRQTIERTLQQASQFFLRKILPLRPARNKQLVQGLTLDKWHHEIGRAESFEGPQHLHDPRVIQ